MSLKGKQNRTTVESIMAIIATAMVATPIQVGW